jgi:transposase-like protein
MPTSPRQRSRRRGGFQPPHCPNPACDFHRPRTDWPFKRSGFFTRPADGRRIQTFQCLHCRRKFSARTFATDYWLKRRELLALIATMISEGPGLRQIGRMLHTTHATVGRHAARLGRHCLLFHCNLLHEFKLREALVVDGFETFEYSQYYPFHINFAVGAQSWFTYHFTDAPLRRKGAMTAAQKLRRAELESQYGRPDPKALARGMAALLRPLIPRVADTTLVLHSDDHPAYPPALRRLSREEKDCPRFDHHVTSSKERRTRQNPLFPVNLADLLARHGSANHRRETIAFSKRRQAAMERAAAFTVWRNCIKRRAENGPPKSAAMHVGLLDRLLTWRQVLRRRLFVGHAPLTPEWADYYWRRVKTAVYGNRQTCHACRYAA